MRLEHDDEGLAEEWMRLMTDDGKFHVLYHMGLNLLVANVQSQSKDAPPEVATWSRMKRAAARLLRISNSHKKLTEVRDDAEDDFRCELRHLPTNEQKRYWLNYCGL
ncbi:uncharacterized protein N7483_006864 [Penicillium malachiteum]|uniref:uncharacterized protein n=1 Tax=Penicillium malachiteum TaxID=1324776 RepID=UPI002546EFEF|nr:uncharacterized protein N7483_006864 [Penicillium malachiteum]KAJ5725507.1 hypothetical protein N7483_006864 [Penicillium malachiteum]